MTPKYQDRGESSAPSGWCEGGSVSGGGDSPSTKIYSSTHVARVAYRNMPGFADAAQAVLKSLEGGLAVSCNGGGTTTGDSGTGGSETEYERSQAEHDKICREAMDSGSYYDPKAGKCIPSYSYMDKLCKEKYSSTHYYDSSKDLCIKPSGSSTDEFDFKVSVQTFDEVIQDKTLNIPVNTQLLKGSTKQIKLTVTQYHYVQDITASLSSSTINAGQSTNLVIKTTCDTHPGDYLFTITGSPTSGTTFLSSNDAVKVTIKSNSNCKGTTSPSPGTVSKTSTDIVWDNMNDCAQDNPTDAGWVTCLQGLLGDPKTDPDVWAGLGLAYLENDQQAALDWAKKARDSGSESSLPTAELVLQVLCGEGVTGACPGSLEISDDLDGDGVSGQDDWCPNTYGHTDNNGCPLSASVDPPAPRLTLTGGLKVKDGVDLYDMSTRISNNFIGINDIFIKHTGKDGTITSGRDSDPKRVTNTKHDTGEAIDLRVSHIFNDKAKIQKIITDLKKLLGKDFQVVDETNRPLKDGPHIHIEYQPKKPSEISTPGIETVPPFDVKKSAAPVNIKPVKEKVPGWIKNNAKWWSDGQIGDSDFVGGIQHMIKEKIIDIPDLPQSASSTAEEKVPDWIKTNAGWWANGQIDEDTFVNGLKWLVEKGIIRV